MINNSILTLADIQTQLNAELKDSVSDVDLIYAINDFYSIVQRLERDHVPEKYELESGAITMTSSGYDLSNLSNIGTLQGLRVFQTSRRVQNRLVKRFKGSLQQGYYLSSSTLFLTPLMGNNESRVVYIDYPMKTDRVVVGSTLSDHTLQIDQDIERALRMYLRHSFYDGEYQYDLRDDAEQKAMEEIERYFSRNTSPRGW